MNKDAALHRWLSSAVHDWEIPLTDGVALEPVRKNALLPAYPSAAVPDNAALPYLTYDASYGNFESGSVPVTVNMWFHTACVDIPDAAALELSGAVGFGGVRIRCDNGCIWLKRGTPFSRTMPTDDPNLKLCYVNLVAEFLTVN